MLKKYILVLLFAPIVLFSQDKRPDLFVDLDKSDMETAILFNHGFSFSEIASDDKNTFTSNGFFQAYNELAQSDARARFLDFELLKDAQNQSRLTNGIPIGLVYTEFDILKESAIENGDITAVNGRLVKSPSAIESIFETKKKLFAAPIRDKIKHLSIDFVLSDPFFLNTSEKTIETIQIDFGDGLGFKNVFIGSQIHINYNSAGTKLLSFRITLDNDEIYDSYSYIQVESPDEVTLTRATRSTQISFTSSITPDLSAYGEPVSYPGQGEYEIFLDTVDGILDKPIIMVDGFDPDDGRTIPGLYSLLDYTDSMGTQNLADFVRSQGYDVVILNFPIYTRPDDSAVIDGGADFIERNAMLLVDLITIINTSKIGTEQNVIIGPSMGGLVTRYALNYMENQSLDHDTRLFLSFDSPHRGANVPIGLQHQLNFLAFGLDGNSVVDLQPLINEFLKSAAARQMLVDHFESHLIGGSAVDFDPGLITPAAHPWKAIFDASINGLTTNGFPQNVRNVAIINGSGIGNPYQDINGGDIAPGFTLLNDIFDVALIPATTADLEINFTPASVNGSQPISKIKVVAIIIVPITLYDVTANGQAFSYSDGIDAGSGGLFDLGGLAADFPATGITADFLNALQSDFFNFIPSLSAIALEITPNGEIDWYHDINIGSGSPPTQAPSDVSDNTPFINWYMPDNNEGHVLLTEANVAFALTEIIPESLSLGDLDVTSIRLGKNPVQDEVTFLTDQPLNQITISLVDIAGRLVYEDHFETITDRITIPIHLNSGMYVANLATRDGTFITKIIVD